MSREANSQRRHHRVTVPLYVAVGARTYRALDWSLGGFRLEDYAGEEAEGAELDGSLILPYADFKIQLPVRFRIVRRRDSEVGCAFVDLGPVQHKALRHVVEAAVEGRLADVGDAIGTLQEPVAAPQLERLLEEEDDAHLYVAGRRVVRMTALYAAIGVATVLVTAALLYRNLMFIDVPDGLIMGNLISVAAPLEGRVEAVRAREGGFVRAGAPLFTLQSGSRTLAVERAQANRRTAQARVRALAARVEEEQARLAMYAEVTSYQVGRTEAAIRRLDAQAEKAAADLERQVALFAEQWVSPDALEIAERDYRALIAERDELRNQLELYRLNERATADGRYFGGAEIEGRLRELHAEQRVARAKASAAEQQVAAAVARLAETRVVAPQDAYVYTVYRRAGELVRPHDPVLSLRTVDGYWAVGRLSPDQAGKIRPGQVVDVVIPPLHLRLGGVVAAIGHHGLSATPYTSPDLESSLHEVPIKVAVRHVPADVPPGMRARLRIHLRQVQTAPPAPSGGRLAIDVPLPAGVADP